MPTSPQDNHDLGRDTLGGTRPSTERNEQTPGYETTDVNVGGVIVFLSGLAGFLVIFFVFCFVMGKVINSAFLKEDGPPTKWTAELQSDRNNASGMPSGGKRENLANNPEMQQRELEHMSDTFPNPRLQTDDGNQATADLHAKEDLLLEHYSTSDSEHGLIRIPIERAMELIVQRGLPAAPQPAAARGTEFAGDAHPVITPPLTSGFARTGYELDVMEARAQKLSYGKAEGAEHAQLSPGPLKAETGKK